MTETRYLLSERTNPHATGGWWGHPTRHGTITAVVVHTAETDPSPASAVNVARWQAHTAPSPSSYHVIVDSDHTVRTVLDSQTAFHVRDFNSPSVGLSFATRASLWGRYPVWDNLALLRAADTARQWQSLYGIPARWLTRDQAQAGVKGFVRHSVMDPSRRGDPGAGFPASRFFQLLDRKADDMPLTSQDMDLIRQVVRDELSSVQQSRRVRDAAWSPVWNARGQQVGANTAVLRSYLSSADVLEAVQALTRDVSKIGTAAGVSGLTAEQIVDELAKRLAE